MNRIRKCLSPAAALLLAAPVAHAAPFTFEVVGTSAINTVNGTPSALDLVQDTRILEVSPTANFGTSGVNVIRSDHGNRQHSLFKFDLSFLDPGLTITDVSLTVQGSLVGSTTGVPYSVHAMTTAWSEANATWQDSDTDTPWGAAGLQAGVDYDANAIISDTISIAMGARASSAAPLSGAVVRSSDRNRSLFVEAWFGQVIGSPLRGAR